MSTDFYEFYCPVKIVAGHKALEHIPHELASHGASKPLIVTDRGVQAAGLVDELNAAMAAAGLEPVGIFAEVPPDSSMQVVSDCARAYRQQQADAIIALGGGSVIDTAKAVNILASEGGDDLHAYTGAGVLKRPLKPFFVVPTTSGTGSEATLVSVIKDETTGSKVPFVSPFLLPDVAVLDPRLTLKLPAKITAATAMDALTHSVEAYLGLAKNPLSDSYATAAIQKISQHLLAVLEQPDDANGRLELAQAATMAGIAFSNSMVGLVHALGHSVGAIAHVPHGLCMSILLPEVLRYNRAIREAQIGELLLYLAGAEIYAQTPVAQRAEKTIAVIEDLKERLFHQCELPRKLSETQQVEPQQLEAIAAMALDDGSMLTNPVDATYEEALAILEACY